ncbi:hypothetical protein ACFLXK_01460 [Chloroflexota bacterium]
MTEMKYEKYVRKPPITEGGFGPFIGFMGQIGGENDDTALIRMRWVTTPCVMEPGNPHKHDFDQYFCFYGGNVEKVEDFGAEVEIWLGEEGEKHTFNTATVVHVPKGLVHCPLNIKRVDKPIIFMTIVFTSKYAQIQKK